MIETCGPHLQWALIGIGAFFGFAVGALAVGICGTARDLEAD